MPTTATAAIAATSANAASTATTATTASAAGAAAPTGRRGDYTGVLPQPRVALFAPLRRSLTDSAQCNRRTIEGVRRSILPAAYFVLLYCLLHSLRLLGVADPTWVLLHCCTWVLLQCCLIALRKAVACMLCSYSTSLCSGQAPHLLQTGPAASRGPPTRYSALSHRTVPKVYFYAFLWLFSDSDYTL